MAHAVRIAAGVFAFVVASGFLPHGLLAQDEVNAGLEREPCAGYEWVLIDGVSSYELVVMELSDELASIPVIEIEMPASATSWTPTLDKCLEPERDYLWSIRGVTADGPGEWLPPVLFRTTSGQMPNDPVAPQSPEDPADSDEPQPEEGSSVADTRFRPGSIQSVPERKGLPTGDLDKIGETEKNSSKPIPRRVGPDLQTSPLSPAAIEKLQQEREARRPPKIGYESEAEAEAAAKRRERERGQAELARQQNELERQRREEARQAADADRQLPAPVVNAVMDLQSLKVEVGHEKRGDEYYLVTYKLRGRLGADDRIYVFDYQKQVWPIQAGKNWARPSNSYSIPRQAGRLVFQDLKPFEVYGFVALLMEANRNSDDEREYAFGFGEFQNEQGVTEVLSGAFERAVPRNGPLPDYSDTSPENVSRVIEQNVDGLMTHFGDYRDGSRGVDNDLVASIHDTIFLPLKRNNPDFLDGVFWGFSMNVPGEHDRMVSLAPAAVFPPINEPMTFRTHSARIIGEHLQYE